MPGPYRYIGPEDMRAVTSELPSRACIERTEDLHRWIKEGGQILPTDRSVTATFVVTTDGRLWIADRHSEHVHCARGQAVLSAGEMTFAVENRKVEVVAITNQSTGYCPEPNSYGAVAAALEHASIPHPSDFTTKFVFRRCPACGTKNIVKDEWFECAVCQGPLPKEWNLECEPQG